MKISTENSQIRRKSNSTAIYLHIPYLNYIFFIFQMRGAYNTVKNYYLFHKKPPSFFTTIVMALKFAFFGAIGSGVLYYLLLLFGFNPFGKMISWYMNGLSNILGGLLGPETATRYFAIPASLIYFANFEKNSLWISAIILIGTYIVFGQLGAWLAFYNLRADLKRNQIL